MTVKKYNPSEIEPKWQKEWDKKGIHGTPKAANGNKKYILDMFPYPSGASMHVGHLEGYVGTDIISRYERMKGNAVLHPMGWDAFGLPAENYAIKTGIHPQKSTHKNIETFKRQLNITGLSYDWNRELDTSSPEFYKWTQWLFILMYKRGLAYKKEADVNWCSSCETVLANEQVVDGKCERCETVVTQKTLSQWFLKITDYADRLISGLTHIDWLEEVKVQQKNWIGRSEGIQIEFKSQNSKVKIQAFTTRPDTLFGATFLVISPESLLVEQLTTKERIQDVSKYIKEIQSSKGKVQNLEKEKTGVFIGSYAINPATGEKIPIWGADYVLGGYGSGAIMAVPAHDQRDFEFAKKYDLPIKQVIKPKKGKWDGKSAFVDEGVIINSGEWDGWEWPGDREKILSHIEKKGWGKRQTSYHLRDWLISRQRYWGAPIPMIYCDRCASGGQGERKDMPGWYTVPEKNLPVLLPKDVDFRPTGKSPISRSIEFQKGVVCPNCGSKATREVDTMDTYVDSSWYFIRFVDNKNRREFASQENIKRWLPVDTYVGGGHVVQHLLFARFFWKVLFDAGLINKSLGDEPFLKLRAPGWILGSDSRKMSKRWNNVVTPDEIIPKYGADTLRMYEMFTGPFEAMKPWGLTGVEGMRRFLNKIWRLVTEYKDIVLTEQEDAEAVLRAQHRLVQKVTKDIEELHFNTAIASMMEYVNALRAQAQNSKLKTQNYKAKVKNHRTNVRCAEWDEALRTLVLLLAPFAPHVTEELWQNVLDQKGSVHLAGWPKFAIEFATPQITEIPVQVNGKLRGILRLDFDGEPFGSELKTEGPSRTAQDKAVDQATVEKEARAVDGVNRYLEGKKIQKVVFIPSRLINFVTSP